MKNTIYLGRLLHENIVFAMDIDTIIEDIHTLYLGDECASDEITNRRGIKIPEYVKGEIYMIKCTHPESNGKIYIGKTQSHIFHIGKFRPHGYRVRFQEHLREVRYNRRKQCTYLYSAIRKYGEEFFTVELLTECDLKQVNVHEIEYIQKYQSNNRNIGYNLTGGGDGGANIETDQREKIAKTLMKRTFDKIDAIDLESVTEIYISNIKDKKSIAKTKISIRFRGIDKTIEIGGGVTCDMKMLNDRLFEVLSHLRSKQEIPITFSSKTCELHPTITNTF